MVSWAVTINDRKISMLDSIGIFGISVQNNKIFANNNILLNG
jgi:hypothetical protein